MSAKGSLRQEVGLVGAVFLGLGSIVGTGIFVSVGLATEISGYWVVLAILLAGGVAVCNGLNSAQLAAAFPVSGGTYEYGYRCVHPLAGLSAGWLFLVAKSASAATAALGAVSYTVYALGINISGGTLRAGAFLLTLAMTWLVARGIRRSNQINTYIVGTTLFVLGMFLLGGVFLSAEASEEWTNHRPDIGLGDIFQATALMFVAYTGYGRIATMSEEVRDPRKTIPQAMFWTLGTSVILYGGVGLVVADNLPSLPTDMGAVTQAVPLERIADAWQSGFQQFLILVGSVTAMLGVLLNLVLGLSRVLLAMGRREDLPSWFAEIDSSGSPHHSVWVMGGVIAALCLIGDVGLTWSLSAVTVLLYYGITNLSALLMPSAQRLFPIGLTWAGLSGCFFLAFWVDIEAWGLALLLLAPAWAWHWRQQRRSA